MSAPKTPAAPRSSVGLVLRVLSVAAVGLLIASGAGCTREAFLSRAVPVADTLEGQVRTTGVDVNRECEKPMERAVAAGDRSAGQAIATKCDEPVTRYEAGRTAHLLLTEVIMQVYAGDDVDFVKAAALIPQAVQAGLRLVAGVRALTGGAK